jgi:hypothetical protein
VSLFLEGVTFAGEGLAKLAQLKHFRRLTLDDCGGSPPLSALRGLTNLSLGRATKLTQEDLAHVWSLTGLEKLTMAYFRSRCDLRGVRALADPTCGFIGRHKLYTSPTRWNADCKGSGATVRQRKVAKSKASISWTKVSEKLCPTRLRATPPATITTGPSAKAACSVRSLVSGGH